MNRMKKEKWVAELSFAEMSIIYCFLMAKSYRNNFFASS